MINYNFLAHVVDDGDGGPFFSVVWLILLIYIVLFFLSEDALVEQSVDLAPRFIVKIAWFPDEITFACESEFIIEQFPLFFLGHGIV